jgi:hypothetical protein
MRNVSDKSCRENQNTLFMFNSFFPENYAVYEIMLKNTTEPDRPQMTVWRLQDTCWIPKATERHCGCVILSALALQQWLHEGASLLRDTYITCLVLTIS